MIIREIQPQDNAQMATIVQTVLMEMGAPKIGTAYSDPFLNNLFEVYDKPKSIYFVIADETKILGGAGVSQLDNCDENICELQKMYFLPEARGNGYASKIMTLCLQAAKDFGFEKCYIETMPYMQTAQKLYLKSGFTYLNAPLGNTGHSSCPVWMIRDL